MFNNYHVTYQVLVVFWKFTFVFFLAFENYVEPIHKSRKKGTTLVYDQH